MDRDLLIANIERYAALKGERITPACIAAGVGKTFFADIKRGQTPSVAKVADLAAYLGCTTSDLVGDVPPNGSLPQKGAVAAATEGFLPAVLIDAWAQLDETDRARLLGYVEALTGADKYKKAAADLDQSAG